MENGANGQHGSTHQEQEMVKFYKQETGGVVNRIPLAKENLAMVILQKLNHLTANDMSMTKYVSRFYKYSELLLQPGKYKLLFLLWSCLSPVTDYQ